MRIFRKIKSYKNVFFLTEDELLLCPSCNKKMIYQRGRDCSATAAALFECECKECAYSEYRGGFGSELFYEFIQKKRNLLQKTKIIQLLNKNRYFCIKTELSHE